MGPLAVMRSEHVQIETALDSLPDQQELGQAQQILLTVISTARNHFAKEEQILYRMAKQALSLEQLSDLGDQWAERRAVTLA